MNPVAGGKDHPRSGKKGPTRTHFKNVDQGSGQGVP
jgi:hypothetical protein